jgi:hypothetical protein
MRLRSSLKWTFAAALLVLMAGPATAQQQPSGTSSTPSGTVPFERNVQLSPQEEADQSDAILSRMDQGASVVRRQLEQAREQRDVVKVLCLNDKLSQIDVAIRSARDRQSALRAASARATATKSPNDIELSTHEFTILTVLKQRSEQLVAEANQCLGEELSFLGATTVVTQVDPTLPGDDVTQYPPTDNTLGNAPPQCLSCDR